MCPDVDVAVRMSEGMTHGRECVRMSDRVMKMYRGHGRKCMTMAIPVQEVTATPSRRSVAFAGTGRRLVCWIVTRVICWNRLGIGLLDGNAGSGCLLDGLVGDLWGWKRWSRRKKGQFLELVDRMGRWPGYGGSAVAMGEWPAYGDLPKRMGKCVRRVVVWGNRETYGEIDCVEGRRITWGSRENVWEIPQDMGNGASIWGGRQAAWGSQKSH